MMMGYSMKNKIIVVVLLTHIPGLFVTDVRPRWFQSATLLQSVFYGKGKMLHSQSYRLVFLAYSRFNALDFLKQSLILSVGS